MRKQITSIILAISLAITSSGWILAHDNNESLLQVIEKQKVDFNKQSTEIANLENVIVQKDIDLQAKQTVIDKSIAEINELKKENEQLKKKNEITVKMTAYIAMCTEGCTGITATGIDVRNTTTYQGYRIIATDPDVIPLYSIVEVDTGTSAFKAIALDTGGAIDGNKVDFLVGSTKEAINFGRQDATITIVREGK